MCIDYKILFPVYSRMNDTAHLHPPTPTPSVPSGTDTAIHVCALSSVLHQTPVLTKETPTYTLESEYFRLLHPNCGTVCLFLGNVEGKHGNLAISMLFQHERVCTLQIVIIIIMIITTTGAASCMDDVST